MSFRAASACVCFAFGIFFASATTAQTSEIGQLLVNPSFELPATGQGQPEGWTAHDADGILAGIDYELIDPPVSTYPDGKQIVRAFGTNQVAIRSAVGWHQSVQVVPGERYTLSGFIQTGKAYEWWPIREPSNQGIARIGVDLDGVSSDASSVDVWCATPNQQEEIVGWQKSDGNWSLISVDFETTGDYVTVFVQGGIYQASEWCSAYMDNVTLTGPVPAASEFTPTPYPTPTPTPSPPLYNERLGRVWSKATTPFESFERSGSVLLNFQNRLWLLGGSRDYYYTASDVLSSTDGLDWSLVTEQAPWASRMNHAGVVFDNKMWVFGGQQKRHRMYINDIWSSPDGDNWTQVLEKAPWGERYGYAAVSHNGAMYILGGFRGNDVFYNDVWRSTDGTNWTLVREHCPWFARRDHVVLSFNGKIWLLGGRSWNDVWCSTDGERWDLVSFRAPWAWRHGHAGFVYDNRMWIVGGIGSGAVYYSDTWMTEDGIHWVSAGSATWPGRMEHTAGVIGQRLVVMGGETHLLDQRNFDDLWYSDAVLVTHPNLLLR